VCDNQGLASLGLSPEQWDILVNDAHAAKLKAIGAIDKLALFHKSTGRQRTYGARLMRLAYGGST